MQIGIGIGLSGRGNASINQQAIAILARYGADAHAYIPGVGTIGGLAAGNYLDSALTIPAAVDNPVGGVVDAVGSIDAKQDTTARKPILRNSGSKYWWQLDGNADSLSLVSAVGATNQFVSIMSVTPAALPTSIPYGEGIGGLRFYFNSVGEINFDKNGHALIAKSPPSVVEIGVASVITCRLNSGFGSIRKNGVITVNSASNVAGFGNGAATIGAAVDGVNFPYSGSIGPLIVIKGAVTDADLLILERWVSSLTLNGPTF